MTSRRRSGRGAFGAAVADRIQHFGDGDRRRLRRNSGRTRLSRDVESALAGVRIGAVLHPRTCCGTVESRRTRIRSGRTYMSIVVVCLEQGTSASAWQAVASPTGMSGRRPRGNRRAKAKAFMTSYPKAAYMSEVERWRELPDGAIEFTMRRLRSAD
jgi:hypothetical protein